jgi:hypothetical protein
MSTGWTMKQTQLMNNRVLDILEPASDYEKEVGRLDENSKGIVKKLQEWAGDSDMNNLKPAGQKRKRTKGSLLCMMQKIIYFLGSQLKKWMTPLHASLKGF